MKLFVIEYNVWDPSFSKWHSNILNKGYSSHEAAEDFCTRELDKLNLKGKNLTKFHGKKHDVPVQYIIHEVTLE